MTDGRIMRNGKYLGNPFFTGVAGDLEQIEGDEDRIPNPEILGTPFVISHIKGSVSATLSSSWIFIFNIPTIHKSSTFSFVQLYLFLKSLVVLNML